MSERPILFSGPMVRAILAGTKTQTRRVFKLPRMAHGRPFAERGPRLDRVWYTNGSGQYPRGNPGFTGDQPPHAIVQCDDGTSQDVTCPYGWGRLWVRETWLRPEWTDDQADVTYAADYPAGPVPKAIADYRDGSSVWKPSIFMPRWASRITLEITSVRVERVQAITEEDAKAEGAGREFEIDVATFVRGKFDADKASTHRLGFKHLWDSINGPRGFGWDANPWVWCVGFKRVEQAPEVVR